MSRYDIGAGEVTLAAFGPTVTDACDQARFTALAPSTTGPSPAHDTLLRAFDRFRLAINDRVDEQARAGELLDHVLQAQHRELATPSPHRRPPRPLR